MNRKPCRKAGRHDWSRAKCVFALVFVLHLAAVSGCASLKRFSYSGFDRDSWQKPEQVVRSLGLQPGAQVADVGAGGGYFTFRLAEAVGPSGKVYAVDVDPEMIAYLKQRAQEEEYVNVEVIEGAPDDPFLPEGKVGLVFLCNTYHHLRARVAYFTRVRKYLSVGGRVAIVEFNRKGWLRRWWSHGTQEDVIRHEMQAAGYQLQQEFHYLPKQHFLVFSQAVK